MAKTLVTYRLYPFDNVRAAAGALCVMVPSSYDGTITVGNTEVPGIKNININNDGTYSSDNTDFLGAGICRYKAPNNYFFSVNSITYTFNERGDAISLNAKRKMLKLAEQVNLTLTASGSVVGNAYPTTRGSVSDQSEAAASTNYNSVGTVLVDTLNARDEFAAQALRGMLAHINDPSTLSDNEIAFYCEEAYRWAASMMLSAANRRANGYENTTDTALGQIATAVSQGSQSTIGMSTAQNSNLTVSPASVTGTGTFTLGVANGHVIPASSDAQNWQRAWTFANSSGINNGTITLGNNSITPLTSDSMWSALNSPDANKKIDASHLPSVGGTFWGNQWSLGGSIDGSITMGNKAVIYTKVTPSGGTEINSQILGLNSNNQLILGFEKNDSLTHSTYIDGTSIRFRYAEGTGRNEALQIGSVVDTRDQYHHGIDSNNPTRITAIKPFEFKTNIYLDQYSLHVGKQLSPTTENPPTGSIRLEQGVPIQYYIESNSNANYGFRSVIISNNSEVAFGYGTRRYRRTVISGGGEIDFTVANVDNGANGTESKVDNALKVEYLSTNSSRVTVLHSLCIGNAELIWDSQNSALKLQNKNGAAAHFCSTGGVTALGIPSSNSGTVDNVSTKQLNIVGDSNTAKLSVVGSELRVTINNTTYRVNLTQIS